MNSILNKMVETLYNRTVGAFADLKISDKNLLIEKCFSNLDAPIAAETYHPENTNKDLEANIPAYINSKASLDKLASYIAGNGDKNYILSKLKEFNKVTGDKISGLLLLNIDLIASDKLDTNILARLDVSVDALLDEIAQKQRLFDAPIFDAPISVKKYLDNVTTYLKQCKTSDEQKYLGYTNILNSLLNKLTREDMKEIDDKVWLSVNDDFSVNQHIANTANDTSNHNFDEIVQIVYNRLKNNNLFNNVDGDFFNDYEYILDIIKDNYDTLISGIEDEQEDNNLTENQKEFVSLVTTSLLARELSISNQIDKSNLLANNLFLFAKKSYDKIEEDAIVQSNVNMINIMENLLKKSLKIANKINNKQFGKDISDYDKLLMLIKSEIKTIIHEHNGVINDEGQNGVIIKTRNSNLKPKTKNKYVSNVLKNLVDLIEKQDEFFTKELSNLRKVDLEKRLVSYKKELIEEYARKYLSEDEKEFLEVKFKDSFKSGDKLTINFSNKELLKKIIEKTENAIITEKSQFRNFFSMLKDDMVSKISKDIITASGKKTFIEKFNKILNNNISKENISKSVTALMDELYDLCSNIVEPVIKDKEVPYKFIRPSVIKEAIIEDSKQQNPKYPNLFNIVKFSQTLSAESAKDVTAQSLEELKKEVNNLQDVNIQQKIDNLIKLINSPILEKQEREYIKKAIKNLGLEIKNSNEDFNGKKFEIVDKIIKMPKVLNAIKFGNSKNDLIEMIEKLEDEDILKQFETDLTQLSNSTKRDIKQKYLEKLDGKLSDDEIKDFISKFDTISIISQNEKNKRDLKNHLTDELDIFVMNNRNLETEKQYFLYELNKKAKYLIDNGFKVKNRDEEEIKKLRETVGEMFKHDEALVNKFNMEIDNAVQDIDFSKLGLQNIHLIRLIKSELFDQFNIDPEISKEIIDKLKKVKTNTDKEEIINEYKPLFDDKGFDRFCNMVKELNIINIDDSNKVNNENDNKDNENE